MTPERSAMTFDSESGETVLGMTSSSPGSKPDKENVSLVFFYASSPQTRLKAILDKGLHEENE